jgi:O-antigen ligase
MSKLASLLCLSFIGYLFLRDISRPDGRSLALWLPTVWVFLAGSRFVSAWLNLSPDFELPAAYAEGSPIDRTVFLSLILGGIIVLASRNINWPGFIMNNSWLVLYLLYCLFSVFWADDPIVLIKRWVKELGIVTMALVILTERNPYQALGVVLRRLAFLFLPLSVLFIKYYPELGRWYRHDGAETFTGAATQKNQLGVSCLIVGIYMAWEILYRRRETYPAFLWQNKLAAIVLLTMLGWLLYKSNSQTSLVCLVVAISIMVACLPRFMARNPIIVLTLLIWTTFSVWFVNVLFPLKDAVLAMLGRRPDLTDRTDIWSTLLEFDVNPIIGVGFMSFWTGGRVEDAWNLLGVRLVQAHNGYVEQYLNLGYVGVFFIAVILLSGLGKVMSRWRRDRSGTVFALCIIFVAAVYNYTEAAFYGLNNMWLITILACIAMPRPRQVFTKRSLFPPIAVNPSVSARQGAIVAGTTRPHRFARPRPTRARTAPTVSSEEA